MAGLLFASLPVLACFAQESPPQAKQIPAPKPAPQAKAQGGDSIGARLGRLEEKIRDLQVMVGTLESFVRAKPGAVLPQEAPPPVAQGQSGDLGPRIDALETQITALTSHIEQIGRQMSALEAKLSAAPALPAPLPPSAERQGEAPAPPSDSASASAAGESDDDGDTSKPRWYGAKPGTDEVAALLEGQDASGPLPAEGPGADDKPQSLVAGLPGGDAQSLYQQGYGALLQKDYAGAEGAFRQLLNAYPKDPLAGDAQYWIGETYYVRGQYKNAADALLKGYKTYKSGQKAPDTLLKLGMALAALGQKDAACSTFNELKAKYPGAPDHIADEAKAERKKAGC
jgi:tol-pal system protein YbgF